MRNVDKYLTEILASTNPSCAIFRLRTGSEHCSGSSCDECNEANKKWLEAEYVEPEIDWSKVPMGTPVRVWDSHSLKFDRYFLAYGSSETYPFMTFDKDTNMTAHYRYAELIEVDNESNY